MRLDIRELPRRRYGYVEHRGAHDTIGPTFHRMFSISGPAGLFSETGKPIGVYFGDMVTMPPGDLWSHAGVLVEDDAALPEGLSEAWLDGGRVAVGVHEGAYDRMSDGWMGTFQALHGSGLTKREAPAYEVYLNDPDDTAEADLRTEIHVPIE